MKNLFFVLIIFCCFSCEEQTEQATSQNQSESKTVTDKQNVVETEQAEKQTSDKLGLTDYDKSKLVFQPMQLLPVDESKQDPTLRKTLDDLLIIINNKDVEGLKSFIDKNITVSFGGENGLEDFITFWDLDLNPKKSMLWDVLKTTITLGGTFDEENKNAYYTPYIFTKFPEDPFEFGIIVGEKVNIRAEPNLKGALVRQLSHELVRLIAYDKPFDSRTLTIGNETHDWLKIEMADGKTGYVWGKFFRSGIDYRAGFSKVRDEGWKMTFLVAGD